MFSNMERAPPIVARNEAEISLAELARLLVRRGWLIVVALLVSLLLALAYVLVATPRYEVEVGVDRPLNSEIAALNLGRTTAVDLATFTPEDVFGYFVRQLRSDQAFQRFFRELYLPSLSADERHAGENQLYRRASRLLSIQPPADRGGARQIYALRMRADDPGKAQRWLQEFLDQVSDDASRKLVDDALRERELKIANTKQELDELRLTAAQKRKDRITELSEALAVAQGANLLKPQVTGAWLPKEDLVGPFVDGSMLYARGAQVLSAELEVLKRRESDDAFIADLREVESRLRMLQSVEPKAGTFRVFGIDGDILVPEGPISPHRPFVFTLAAVLGLVLGVALAFAVELRAGGRRARGVLG
jgi:chain length determinant protein (polysaccharide antigen chain regulator)